MFDQSGIPSSTFYKFDPVLHLNTGESHLVPLQAGTTDQFAGGAFITEEFDPDTVCIGGIAQGVDSDFLFMLELTATPEVNLEVNVTYQSGSPVPLGGGILVFDVYLENISSFTVDFDAWIAIQYENNDPQTVILRPLTAFAPGNTIIRNGMILPIPGAWSSGNYLLWGRAGIHPSDIYAEDNFPFIKIESDNEEKIVNDWKEHPDQSIDAGRRQPFTGTDNFDLISACPNPFNPSTEITYIVTTAGTIDITVFDLKGCIVSNLIQGYFGVGTYSVDFNAGDLASGIYFCRMQTESEISTEKLIVNK